MMVKLVKALLAIAALAFWFCVFLVFLGMDAPWLAIGCLFVGILQSLWHLFLKPLPTFGDGRDGHSDDAQFLDYQRNYSETYADLPGNVHFKVDSFEDRSSSPIIDITPHTRDNT